MINPGTLPVPDATEAAAADNIRVFVAAVREQGGEMAGDPVRDPDSDRDGRYGYRLAGVDGASVHVLMPGAPLAAVRDDRSAGAPCLYVGGEAWWWPSAVLQAGGAMR